MKTKEGRCGLLTKDCNSFNLIHLTELKYTVFADTQENVCETASTKRLVLV